MNLGKTFTRSLVREVGRNYGKAISNSLLGDRHSTPIRIVSSSDVSRQRGKIYDNDFDKSIKKFEIKGHTATFNQVLNIHSTYFVLVEEANADGFIDLTEMSFLVQQVPRGISVLERAQSALSDLGKPDLAEKTQEKIEDFKDFMISLDGELKIEKLPSTKFNSIAVLFLFLSFVGLDRLYFKPKSFWSYFYGFFGFVAIVALVYDKIKGKGYFLFEDIETMGSLPTIVLYMSASIYIWYGMLLNPIQKGGYWGYRKSKGNQKKLNKLARSIKEYTTAQISTYATK